MILNKDVSPTRKIYYLGAIILSVLEDGEGNNDFLTVYNSVKEKEGISIGLFTLAIDWLYIVGAVNASEGNISKCF
ncbi:ABC-three component system middle component 6 [Corallincola spongiicola]|uniref:Uncharacterized protein n=1 Tax=Corallincola spongiicola TaxID=2520508 RepID=A0ABY1WLK5_9GAMM|nr:ABC-three component system middle component 6 [Corallincola spongiicola]TAA41802.1 hypothetical protein EXY25_16330 [Corallincola spongiicola]